MTILKSMECKTFLYERKVKQEIIESNIKGKIQN